MDSNKVSITEAGGTWVVRAGGAVIGESSAALELVIGDAAPVIYFPREDIGMAFLDTSITTTRTRELGEAKYYGIVTRSTVIEDAAWSFTTPNSDAARIADHVAFDTTRVTVEGV